MPCYYPLRAFQSKTRADGKVSIAFSPTRACFIRLELPCGRCIGCRLERSRQWAVRIMHEAQLHDLNCFITLTYSSENLPVTGSLRKGHFQLFMKRLRKAISPKKVRFYACGEYGDQLSRPHYHAILFGVSFSDLQFHTETAAGKLYSSQTLEDLWGLGFCTVGSVTFDSAAYVARYCTKKINGPIAKNHYERVDQTTGEVVRLQPEFSLMSRRPGIASDWIEKFQSDVYPSDQVISKGFPAKPPRYYDKILEVKNPEQLTSIKEIRRDRAHARDADNSTARLRVRETVAKAKLNLKRRVLDQ
ncbi:MAG: replication initiator protein [Microviridae sp.]|nr:MAG: replication initiator protein [Microviridae sp.]